MIRSCNDYTGDVVPAYKENKNEQKHWNDYEKGLDVLNCSLFLAEIWLIFSCVWVNLWFANTHKFFSERLHHPFCGVKVVPEDL